MFGAREFALMPAGSFFVNTARGRLVDEDALVAALESGHLGGAALDVFRYEPLQADSPLLHAPRTCCSPLTPAASPRPSRTCSSCARLPGWRQADVAGAAGS